MAGALAGLTVVDFGQYLAGPMTGMLLADQGADVVKIDPPGGPRLVTPANQIWNRGKREITLDLKQAPDLRIARDLIANADVVIENFRPAAMDRLGLGYESIAPDNPRLVYCSIPGFAHDDSRAALQAWEGVIQAAAAVPSRPGVPAMSAVPLASVFGAFFASTSIAMAIVARNESGRGQWIEVPLFDAALGAHGFRVQRVHSASAPPNPDAPLPGVHSWMGSYECADGRYVFFHPGNKHAVAFVDAIGGAGWSTDPQRDKLIRGLFRTRTAAQWEQLGAEFGTEIAIFRTSAEWLREPHAQAAGIVVQSSDPVHGPMLQPGLPVWLSRTPGAVGDPPETADVSVEIEAAGPSRAATAPSPIPRTDAPPQGVSTLSCLHGVRVLEMSLLLAGPTAGRTMVEFGADVIKLENPHAAPIPDAWIDSYHAFHLDVNRGKRSMIVDLKTHAGREVFWKLVEDADVILQNYRPGVMDDLGLGYEAVSARNPRIIYASINTYGMHGPWKDRAGHEHLGQAVSGMAERFGGDTGPKFQTLRAPTDHGTGLLAAYGIALALIERQRSGQGQQVNAALAMTATLLQAPMMYDFGDRAWDEIRGQEALGSVPTQRLYLCADGWLFMGCSSADRSRVTEVAGIQAEADDGTLTKALDAAFREDSVAGWVGRLAEAGISAHRLVSIPELLGDPDVLSRHLVMTREHTGVGLVDQLCPIPRLSDTPVTMGRPATPLGSEWREILSELGRAVDIQVLVDQQVVRIPRVPDPS